MKKLRLIFWLLCFCPITGILISQHVSHLVGGLFLALQCLTISLPAKMLHDHAPEHRQFHWTMLGMAIFFFGILILLYGMMSLQPSNHGLRVPDSDINAMRRWMPWIVMTYLVMFGIGFLMILDIIRKRGRANESAARA